MCPSKEMKIPPSPFYCDCFFGLKTRNRNPIRDAAASIERCKARPRQRPMAVQSNHVLHAQTLLSHCSPLSELTPDEQEDLKTRSHVRDFLSRLTAPKGSVNPCDVCRPDLAMIGRDVGIDLPTNLGLGFLGFEFVLAGTCRDFRAISACKYRFVTPSIH